MRPLHQPPQLTVDVRPLFTAVLPLVTFSSTLVSLVFLSAAFTSMIPLVMLIGGTSQVRLIDLVIEEVAGWFMMAPMRVVNIIEMLSLVRSCGSMGHHIVVAVAIVRVVWRGPVIAVISITAVIVGIARRGGPVMAVSAAIAITVVAVRMGREGPIMAVSAAIPGARKMLDGIIIVNIVMVITIPLTLSWSCYRAMRGCRLCWTGRLGSLTLCAVGLLFPTWLASYRVNIPRPGWTAGEAAQWVG